MKKVLVIGLGKSGIGSVKLLSGKANVSVYDAKTIDKIDKNTLSVLSDLGVECFFGTAPNGNYDEVVVSPAVPMDNPVVSSQRKSGADILGELELSYRYCKGEFIGITGTNGKTTTTTLVGAIMKAAEFDTQVVGNIGDAISETCEQATENTKMVSELSSFQLETINRFHAHISAVLNLTPDHLDRHKTFEGYIAAKARITENQTLSDFFIYNYEDLKTRELADSITNVTKVPFSAAEDCSMFETLDYSAYVNSDGKICVRIAGKTRKLCQAKDLQIPGHHNLENALAAAAIAIFAGAPAPCVSKVLKSFKGVEHRLEFVREHNGVRYVNDSKGTNPDSSIKAIEAMKAPIILIAGGYDKKLDFTEFIESFNGKVSYLLLIGVTADQLADTARKCGFPDENIIKFNSLEACVAGAAKLAQKGDTVLLSPACASWGMFENYEQRGREFKKFVKEL